MAFFKKLDRKTDFWGQPLSRNDPYRRLIVSDEEMLVILSNKFRNYEYDTNSTEAALIGKIAKLLRYFLGPFSQHRNNQAGDESQISILLTGLELQHLHKLCDFEIPNDIYLEHDYLVEPQIFEALLEKARNRITSI